MLLLNIWGPSFLQSVPNTVAGGSVTRGGSCMSLTGLQGDLVTVSASAAAVFFCSVPATLASGLHLELFPSRAFHLPFPLPLAVLFKIMNEFFL